MPYKKNTRVLPNFVKALAIIFFSLSANLSMAEHHGEAEDKIRDLKDMTPSKLTTTDLDSDTVTSEANDQVEEMINEAKDTISEEAKQQANELVQPEG